MFSIEREEIEWAGRTLVLETGRVARQADAAVMATYGDTTVLATVVAAKEERSDIDFFPLTVHYQEKAYAAGKIPGGYFKREGRPSEYETLTSRLIDRPIRPLFVDGFKCETQVLATVLSHDLENDSGIVAMIAASAALTLSGLPFMGPIGAARVGYINGEYIINPLIDQMQESELDLVVAGTRDAVLMVESEAKELNEETMLAAVMAGFDQFQPVIEAIINLAERASKPPRSVAVVDNSAVQNRVHELAASDIADAYVIADKSERNDRLSAIKEDVIAKTISDEDSAGNLPNVEMAFRKISKDIVRNSILDDGKRIDGRGLEDVRPIDCQVGILPRTHGSALFTRGETQALVVVTLGTGEDVQYVDAMEGTYKEAFMLHYNFPSYSVGETGRVGPPGRREIGHGKLAWRSIHPLLPDEQDFPYTVRVVSEITESNGSSSMATVCGASLAMMDSGLPMPKSVAGIAMGLILKGDRYAVLSDILGDEDHLGDMDFKVAGTADGITALQMDIKVAGITEEIMSKALNQANAGRLHILGEMNKAISTSRPELVEHAPRIEVIKIAQDKIREVIGTGGKVIKEIVEETGAKIDIADDGTIKIASTDGDSIKKAISWIESIAHDPEVGKIYDGTVVKTVDFGAFVRFFGSKDGLVHISELSDKRAKSVTSIVNEGDKVKVKLIGIDNRGKFRLSIKGAQ